MQTVTEIGSKCYCGSGEFARIEILEQMLGFREPFTYAVCQHCGHAYLLTPPPSLAKYYPQGDYYSFKATKRKGVRSFFSSDAMKAFKHLSLGKRTYILDYGCGNGQFVKELHSNGFTGATGYDPFLPNDSFENGAPLLRRELNAPAYREYYDVITMNHALEHVPNPLSEIKMIADLLKPGGFLIIRVPVKDSYAYEKYGVHWAQWDAPRHFHLFTRMSLRCMIGNATELEEINMHDDSNHFQFTASEIYLKGGSLKNNNRFLKRLLSVDTYRYSLKAVQLNKQNKGDQVTLIVKKISQENKVR